jgi:hypothetical protein
LRFIRRFLVSKARERSAYGPAGFSYWYALGDIVHAVVQRFGLMVQEVPLIFCPVANPVTMPT